MKAAIIETVPQGPPLKELQASSHGVEGTSHYTASRSEVRAEYVGRRAKDDRELRRAFLFGSD